MFAKYHEFVEVSKKVAKLGAAYVVVVSLIKYSYRFVTLWSSGLAWLSLAPKFKAM